MRDCGIRGGGGRALVSNLMDWMDSGAGSDGMGDHNRFVGIIMRSEISDTEATSARTL